MCKAQVKFNSLQKHWIVRCGQYQSLTMALNDLQEIQDGYRIYYILDGYDFNTWLYPKSKKANTNSYHNKIKKQWNDYFRLSDGINTCAVLSPFTIIQFLYATTRLMNDDPIRLRIQQHPEIVKVIESIQQGEQTFEGISENQKNIIRSLFAQILDIKNASDLFLSNSSEQSDPFYQLRKLMKDGKIRIWDLPVPRATQVNELLSSEYERTQNAINYLSRAREKQSHSNKILSSSLDTYHYILVNNSRQPWRTNRISPNLTSSGILSRNSWYMLTYNNIPGFQEMEIPQEWGVRTGDEPSLLLSTLAQYKDPKIAREFLQESLILAGMIKKDLNKIPELRSNRVEDERERLIVENPDVIISTGTLELMIRLDNNLRTISIPRLEPSSLIKNLEKITRSDAEVMGEYINNPHHYDEMMRSTAKSANENIQQLDLPLTDLASYLAPMGDGVDELINSIDSILGFSLY